LLKQKQGVEHSINARYKIGDRTIFLLVPLAIATSIKKTTES